MCFLISIFHIYDLPLLQSFLTPLLISLFVSLRQATKGEIPGERCEGEEEKARE